MNEHQLREALRAVAHKEIPDTMNRWESIRSKVRPRPQRGLLAWSMTRLVVVFAVLILALLTIAVGYAVFFHWGDPGMKSVEEAGLITPVQITSVATVNATQADPGSTGAATPGPTSIATAQSGQVTATLDTVYADEQRVAITYTLRNLPRLDQTRYYFETNISYADGSLFNASSGGWTDPGPEPDSLVMHQSFEHHEPFPPDGTVDVVFTIRVLELVPNVSGSMPEPLYTLQFPVTLTVLKGVDIQVEETQTISGIAVTLKQVTITPSSTQLVLCYDLPPGSIDWSPVMDLSLDGQPGLWLGGGVYNWDKSKPLTSPVCQRMVFSTPYTPDAKHLTVTVKRLQTSVSEVLSQEVLDRAKERLAAQGIEVTFKFADRGFGWDVVRAPEGMDEAEIGLAVRDALTEQVQGPWVFEVEIPQGQ